MGYVSTLVDAFNANGGRHAACPAAGTGDNTGVVQSESGNAMAHATGTVGTLTMVEALLLTALSVAREREQGTFDQLLVTPLRPFEIMVGKAMPSVLIGIAQERASC